MASDQYPRTFEDLQTGRDVFGNSFIMDPNRPLKPVWFDQEKFSRGQDFFKRFVMSICVGFLMSLLVGFAVPSLAEAVMVTHNSSSPEKSRKRYLATLAHIYTWHTTNIFDPGSKGYASLKMVRNYHDLARFRLKGTLKVNQYDTACVQSGFVGPVCMYPEKFGINCREEDVDDYRYLWRVIGYVLGIEDEFNVCGGILSDTRHLVKQVEQKVVVPELEKMEPFYITLCNDFLEGMKPLIPIIDKSVLYAFVFPLMNIPSPELSILQSVQLQLLKIHFWVLRHCSFYRSYMNYVGLKDLEQLKNIVLQHLPT